jgi:uncharacterized protein YebE (UPF0316 family)
VLTLLLYLALGILSDVLVTGYYICVGRGLALLAALVSLPIALLNFWVLGTVIVLNPSWANAAAYALGTGVGCYSIMKLSKIIKHRTKGP